jgi:site-specific DNA-cytosine methylase
MVQNENYTYAIRKLTPLECFRLMNFRDSDYEAAAKVNSRSQLYKQAGNSIVVSVLMATFSQLNIKGVKCWNNMSETEKYELIYKNCGKPRD